MRIEREPRSLARGTDRSAVAALNSVVEYEDLADGRRARALLVHPTGVRRRPRTHLRAVAGRPRTAGRRAGHDVEVTLPSGDTRSLMIVAVHEGSDQ